MVRINYPKRLNGYSNWINVLCLEPACDPFIADLLKKLCEVNMFVRGKYGPLCCLLDVVGAQAMLEIHPSIPEDVMTVMSDQTVVPHVRNANLLQQIYRTDLNLQSYHVLKFALSLFSSLIHERQCTKVRQFANLTIKFFFFERQWSLLRGCSSVTFNKYQKYLGSF